MAASKTSSMVKIKDKKAPRRWEDDDPQSDLLNELIDFKDFESLTDLAGTYELTYMQFRELYVLKRERQ